MVIEQFTIHLIVCQQEKWAFMAFAAVKLERGRKRKWYVDESRNDVGVARNAIDGCVCAIN